MRAKFKCESVVLFESNKSAKLRATTSTEDTDFTKWTPAGYLEITIDNNAKASNFFIPGKYYYLDFNEVVMN